VNQQKQTILKQVFSVTDSNIFYLFYFIKKS